MKRAIANNINAKLINGEFHLTFKNKIVYR